MGNPLTRLSLRLSVPLALVVPVLVTAVALIVIGVSQGRTATRRLAADNLVEIHREITGRVEALLSLPAKINRINETLLRQGLLHPTQVRSWRGVLFAEASDAAGLSSIVWATPTGQDVNIARYAADTHLTFSVLDGNGGGGLEQFLLDDHGEIIKSLGGFPFDARQRPWYRSAVGQGRGVWGEPYVWVSKITAGADTVGIAYSQPVRGDDGELLGVLAAELSLDDISRFLAALHIGRNGVAFIVDGDGRLLACSRGDPVTDGRNQPIFARDSRDADVAAVASLLGQGGPGPAQPAIVATSAIDLGGQRRLLRVSPIAHGTGLNWLIVTVAPESDFLAEIQAGQTLSMALAAGVVLLALLLGLAVALAMTRPILALVAHVRRLGGGELDAHLSIRQSPELRYLSGEINLMAAHLRDRLRMQQSLALAMDVQQNLLPRSIPQIQGLDISGHSTYCDETGGDYYDYLDLAGLSPNAVAVAIGDVSGHGIATAMVMANAKGVLRSRCRREGTLGEMLTHMNDLIVDELGDGLFMTMLLMAVDARQRAIRWASAGHDMPFVYDPTGDRFIEIEGSGLPLGIVPGQKYEDYCLNDLPPGAVILAGTDGLWETANDKGEFYGKERVCQSIRRDAVLSAADITDRLRQDLLAFRGSAPQKDDITFVAVKVTSKQHS